VGQCALVRAEHELYLFDQLKKWCSFERYWLNRSLSSSDTVVLVVHVLPEAPCQSSILSRLHVLTDYWPPQRLAEDVAFGGHTDTGEDAQMIDSRGKECMALPKINNIRREKP
jgi:hypothetical protein